MPSGKSCSSINPDGIRRIVNGKTLVGRSKRKVEKIIDNVQRWVKDGETWKKVPVIIERLVSKVFE